MIEKVELKLEIRPAVGNRRRRETARCHIERAIPPMVHLWSERELNFPDDLSPQLQCAVGGFPLFQRKRRPLASIVVHRHTISQPSAASRAAPSPNLASLPGAPAPGPTRPGGRLRS